MNKPTTRRQWFTPLARKGLAAVECAAVAPLLVLLILGAVDVGQYANVYQKISDASREGARVSARFDTSNTSDVETAVMAYLQDVFPKESSTALAEMAEVTVTDSAGNPISGGDLTSIASGSQVAVNVTLPYDDVRWISHLKILSGSEVTATSMMRRE